MVEPFTSGVADAEVVFASRPFAGETSCGDQGRSWVVDDKVVFCLVDGLGHGKRAQEAALAALAYIECHLSKPVNYLIRGCDRAIRGSRGVALGIAIVDRMAATLTFAGIGNIHGQIVGAEITRLLSCRGVVGGGFRSVRPETLKLNPGDLVTLFTDGVDERVVVSTAQASSCDNLQKFAATIIDEWGLEKDDVGAMIFRNR